MAVSAVLLLMAVGCVCVSSDSPLWSSKHMECVHLLKHLHRGTRVTVQMPPDVQGHWVSTSCEVRPGPEFIMRSYRFFPNNTFETLQFYYSDNQCSRPTHTLIARGRLRLRQPSWITRGGTEAEYTLQSIQVVCHSPAVARSLSETLRRVCVSVGSLRPAERVCVWSEESSCDASRALNFSLHELQLLRLEKLHVPLSLERPLEQLLLGDVHTDTSLRFTHRPHRYQPALLNAQSPDPGCVVCGIVSRSDELHPPVLPPRPELTVVLQGQWASRRCELRPDVLFLTRHFIFHEHNSTWEGHYHHYSDPACRHATFSLTARGRYSRGRRSTRVMGGTEFMFRVEHMRVTPMDQASATLLNDFDGNECGDQGAWQVGVEQDVTPTNGCVALGIRLPHTEYELFRVERDAQQRLLLFNGARPSDGSSPDRPERRATSYQPALVQCVAGRPHDLGNGCRDDLTTAAVIVAAGLAFLGLFG